MTPACASGESGVAPRDIGQTARVAEYSWHLHTAHREHHVATDDPLPSL